ncbi:uncharacterized protein LOC110265995 [Arachis ipaensis]|uniref:uncharacterized protein LOC110265995 n=1 Tax=Arachis ipaensis TaxID=130454 RepID=UPI000A2B2EC1|nr:uncharacterized protein LOC110265995 [Arachis ipaensis]
MARQSEKETLILSSFDSAAQPREREDERSSFSLGISPPASQPTQPSEESDSQLDILAEVVVEAGVEAALKFAEGTSSEPTIQAAQTKDGTNEYERLFVLKHEGLYVGLREYFRSLKPEEQVHAVYVS